ncbi:hypothetical protein [Neptuniibacter sp. QD37_11]|uniref:hypothetical protein n=1 Tax=Neptuniibacter sp. QD37_11 TaxID=3398209 RepID=UPI0039F51BFC
MEIKKTPHQYANQGLKLSEALALCKHLHHVYARIRDLSATGVLMFAIAGLCALTQGSLNTEYGFLPTLSWPVLGTLIFTSLLVAGVCAWKIAFLKTQSVRIMVNDHVVHNHIRQFDITKIYIPEDKRDSFKRVLSEFGPDSGYFDTVMKERDYLYVFEMQILFHLHPNWLNGTEINLQDQPPY